MTTKEQIEIIQAYERGEEIEVRYKDKFSTQKWFSLTIGDNCQFDFIHNEYRIKPKRWRAKGGDYYYCISRYGEINVNTEFCSDADAQMHKNGNYFRTREQAEKAMNLIKECLTKFHEECIDI